MCAWPPNLAPDLWLWQAATDADVGVDVPPHANAFAALNGRLVQRVGASRHVAVLPFRSVSALSGTLPRAPAADGERDPCIEELWPAHGVPVDMRAAFAPGALAECYDEAVWGSAPVALFVKQTLGKARALLAADVFARELRALVVAPEQIEQRYFKDAAVEQRAQAAQAHRSELVPVAQLLRQLRLRDTQLQVVLGLELLNSAPDIEPVLDHHFDRLCIWQAVGDSTDTLDDFCTAVVLPFYKSRCPHKAKQFVQRSRGTLKTRSRKPPKNMATPSVALPTGGGLLRALQMTGSQPAASPLPAPPAEPSSASVPRASAAVRSASHPLYTMASRQNTVEVRFKRPRKHGSERAALDSTSSNPPAMPEAAATAVGAIAAAAPPSLSSVPAVPAFPAASSPPPPPLPPLPRTLCAPRAPRPPQSPPLGSRPLPASVEKKVQATPKKERSKFLESLKQPLPFDLDAVESTDSDE